MNRNSKAIITILAVGLLFWCFWNISNSQQTEPPPEISCVMSYGCAGWLHAVIVDFDANTMKVLETRPSGGAGWYMADIPVTESDIDYLRVSVRQQAPALRSLKPREKWFYSPIFKTTTTVTDYSSYSQFTWPDKQVTFAVPPNITRKWVPRSGKRCYNYMDQLTQEMGKLKDKYAASTKYVFKKKMTPK